MSLHAPQEWLETDGLGGFASGTATGIRTRRYHALLLTATTPPTGRVVLVNGFDACVETSNGRFSLSSQIYAPGIVGGDGAQRLEGFGWEPWPHWIYRLEDGTRIQLEIFVIKDRPITCLSWKLLGARRDAILSVRPFLSGRDYHSLHKCNPAFRFEPRIRPDRVSWQPYVGVPGITALTNGGYSHEPHWYYNFHYEEEQRRGLDCEEDLAAPGIIRWNLADGTAPLIFTTTGHADTELPALVKPVEFLNRFREMEKRRRENFPSRLERSADAYIVTRSGRRDEADKGADPECLRTSAGRSKTIIAGYPWFTDWGRDTFLALRGLCLATGRLRDARDILLAWAGAVSEGMLPNRFPDHGEQPEYNSADASLWFIIAVHEYLERCSRRHKDARDMNSEIRIPRSESERLRNAIQQILEGYSNGTRFGIRMDDDGLLACGVPGSQLTWMDAKIGDWVITPRSGKPVEIQALWLNALKIGAQFSTRWQSLFERGVTSFRNRFWNSTEGCLFDVVDCEHRSGAVDATFRPNQILAVGGLPFALLEGEQAAAVVAKVEARLWVPLGLRSLAPDEPGYTARYEGGVRERDSVYHQGTVWPWLIGPFVEAWIRVRGETNAAKREARGKFLPPLLAHLEEAGLGHVSEIADAEPPHVPRGCPFQAWSVAELLRLDRVVLAEKNSFRETKVLSGRTRELVPA